MTPPRGSKSWLAHWYDRFSAFNVESLFSRKRPIGPPRTVFVHEPLPQEYLNSKGKVDRSHVFNSNQIITSKYNIITFIPRNLLEQFRRIANMFFLAIAILQFFPIFSTIAPGAAILPLIVILVITALKDGYEDFKRHQSDSRVNNTQVRVLEGGGWKNPNVTEGKSKTFIPKMLPKRSKSAKLAQPPIKSTDSSSSSSSSIPKPQYDLDQEFDYHGDDESSVDAQVKPHWKTSCWEDVKVGDFVKILEDEPIPADILICATSEDENIAFVETKNLDGETNLKSRRAVNSLSHLRNARECANPRNGFHIQCERPDTDMYRLNGNVTTPYSGTSSVDLSTTLLRGTVLRNTGWVIGVVLFTGWDTKIILNSGGTPSKRSKVERQMNPQVLINLGILAVMSLVCGAVNSVLEQHNYPLGALWLYGDNQSDNNPHVNGAITWAYALLTFQDIVPISLYISIEFVKTCQAAFIYFDSEIYYAEKDQATLAKSWNLSDDLGQIQYIFSDKTGTLTQNLMVFRMCSIGGKAYRGNEETTDTVLDKDPAKSSIVFDDVIPVPTLSARPSGSRLAFESTERGPAAEVAAVGDSSEHFTDSVLLQDLQDSSRNWTDHEPGFTQASALNGFFTVLSLCHTAIAATDPETGHVDYKAQSPDEAALVRAAADAGFVFLGKDKDLLLLRTPRSADIERYELLGILDFTSARKRMSAVVRRVDGGARDGGNLLLLTKGADNVIFERLRPGEEDLKADTEHHLSEFANNGLRTLTLAYRTISAEEYESWSRRYQQAQTALDDREQLVENVASELEQNLHLLGATAIEDRLQDGVPEAIADLKKAGIKIWVATGDKMETAIAIGRSTNLVGHESNIIIIRGASSRPVPEQMANALDRFFPEHSAEIEKNSPPSSPLDPIPLQRVHTGVSSMVGLNNGDRPGGFILVVDGAALLEAFADEENKEILLRLAILCDGVICCRVSPLQKALVVKLVKDGLGAMTLAIGDGANDVSMIQAADVGVGISGEEGLQAVNSSDYAIAQFRYLKKLLLVHGHWSYARNGIMILNFFYKNIVAIGVLWWFQIYSEWSANFVFDYTYVLLWNSIWTIAPVIGVGLFDRFMDSRTLMQVPELYRYGREGRWFGLNLFLVYMFNGIVQSAIIYFFIAYAYKTTSARQDGWDVYINEFSTVMAISAVLVADLFTGLTSTAWTIWLAVFILIGIVVEWLYTIIYSLLDPNFAVTTLYGNTYYLFHSPYFWFCLPLTFLLSMAPWYLFKAYKAGFNPGDLETMQYLQNKYPNTDLSRFSRSSAFNLLSLSNPAHPQHTPMTRRDSTDDWNRPSDDAESIITIEQPSNLRSRPDWRSCSRVDMSTGLASVDRGFDFVTEEHGVEMRRVQTNLSERKAKKHGLLGSHKRSISGGSKSDKGKHALGVLSLPRAFSMKRKPPPS
ncbi:hypothetical protein CPB83DRAFT_846485 [Crepidotus variabilis]|uniref:Phospholipid-transporting ATPase n=1 Tax=Crepidotus variabilis TaxID=179855 RepID=A0A9P6EQI9_9AGAR|nr:hypothetical protein CPB83DRAFT_846485 [Crepidotus variabilis]